MNWNFDISNLIQIFVILIAGFGTFMAMRAEIGLLRGDLSNLEKRTETLAIALNQLGTILTQIAVQDSRLNTLAKDIDEIRHGQGFVVPTRLTKNGITSG